MYFTTDVVLFQKLIYQKRITGSNTFAIETLYTLIGFATWYCQTQTTFTKTKLLNDLRLLIFFKQNIFTHNADVGYTIFNDMSARDAQAKEMPGMLGPAKSKDFDTGNIMLFQFPVHWISILGKRIKNVHLKEFTKKGTDHSLESFRPLLDERRGARIGAVETDKGEQRVRRLGFESIKHHGAGFGASRPAPQPRFHAIV